MLASCKLQRVSVKPLLRQTRVKYVLAKHYYGRSGDGEDMGKNFDNEFYQFCLCCGCPCGGNPTIACYDARKYGHCLPQCNVCPDFETIANIPSGVFRCTTGEQLGPQGQASKCCQYLSPEYFSYHHMSYYDFHYALRQCRLPCAKTNRKPP